MQYRPLCADKDAVVANDQAVGMVRLQNLIDMAALWLRDALIVEGTMDEDGIGGSVGASDDAIKSVERVYRLWDEALGAKDVEAAIALYAPDTVLESPLVRHLLKSDEGIVEGREKLREFLHVVFDRTPPSRRRYRAGFFTDGRKLMWEYPRATPEGEQMDFVEVMEIENGLIRRHCVYWGWFGVKVLESDRYRR